MYYHGVGCVSLEHADPWAIEAHRHKKGSEVSAPKDGATVTTVAFWEIATWIDFKQIDRDI